MNQEKSIFFKGQEKVEEEAGKINEKVDAYYKNPRTNKSRPADEVAHELIKKEKSSPISLFRLPIEEKLWYENMRTAGIRILNDGFLEISRWDNTGKHKDNPKLIWQKVDGLNSAIRMQSNILDKYRSKEQNKSSEFEKLESIQEVIENANELLTRWKIAKPEDKEAMQIQLTDVILQLEKCRNEFKVAAKDQAAAVVELKDSLGRENPGAFAARTVAALNNLAKRINEMQLIAPAIAYRKESLVLEKRRADAALDRSIAHLNGVLHHSVFHKDARRTPESRINLYEVTELDRKIGKALYLLDSLHTAPYLQQAEQAKFYISNKAKKFFSSKSNLIEHLNAVMEALEEARNILESDIEQLG